MSKILTLSYKAINDLIINQEVSSREHYYATLTQPIWPGGMSGITIGLGYDVGTVSVLQLQKDWASILQPSEIIRLSKYCGKMGAVCKSYLPIPVTVTWDQAKKVFFKTSLVNHARMAANVYPGLENLHPYEQTAIVGIVYCRGNSIAPTDRRKEMRALVAAIQADDDTLMASLVISMERLWGNDQRGLKLRMELSAKYIALPDIPIPDDDKLQIEI